MRSADTTAVLAVALREDDTRLVEILDDLPVEDVARLADAADFLKSRTGRHLTGRIARSAA